MRLIFPTSVIEHNLLVHNNRELDPEVHEMTAPVLEFDLLFQSKCLFSRPLSTKKVWPVYPLSRLVDGHADKISFWGPLPKRFEKFGHASISLRVGRGETYRSVSATPPRRGTTRLALGVDAGANSSSRQNDDQHSATTYQR